MTNTPPCKYSRAAAQMRRAAELGNAVSHPTALNNIALMLAEAAAMRARLAVIDAPVCEVVYITDRLPTRLTVPVMLAHETPDGAA